MTRASLHRLLTTFLALAPAAAMAHPGHDSLSAGFVAGLMHPLTGVDHVLMIVAVSAWASLLPQRGRMVVAASLAVFVAVGASLPVSPGAGLEAAIALTVVGAGVLLAIGRRWPVWATGLLAAVFAMIHGFAHGAEGPAHSLLYVPGLAVATGTLALLVTAAAGLPVRRDWWRAAGALSAVGGMAAIVG